MRDIWDPKCVADKLDCEKIKRFFGWLEHRDQKCIISPDTDGIMCGLFVSNYLKWEIKGIYDGRFLIIFDETYGELNSEKVKSDFIFLDIEVSGARGIGNHMQLFYSCEEGFDKVENEDVKKSLEAFYSKFKYTLNPNNLRGYGKKGHFSKKYPFATIHFLIAVARKCGIVEEKIKIKDEGKFLLLYADGTFKNLFNYPENCIKWMEWLSLKNDKIFQELLKSFQKIKIGDLIHNLKSLFAEIKERGKLTDENGDLNKEWESILKFYSEKIGWSFYRERWFQGNQIKKQLNRDRKKGLASEWKKLIEDENLFSLAIPAGNRIEYTLWE